MKRVTSKDSPGIQRVLQWEEECVDTAEEHGRPTSAELPDDMKPQSTADTSAL